MKEPHFVHVWFDRETLKITTASFLLLDLNVATKIFHKLLKLFMDMESFFSQIL